MAILKYVKESKDSTLLSLCIIEGEESAYYTVNASTYADIGSPKSGEHISEGDLATIKYADTIYRAEKKALSILAYADNNRQSLKQKLLRAGFDREISDLICEKMVELGYINERRQLERLVLSEANLKLRGPGRIIPALVTKGYNSFEVREVLRELCDRGEIDFAENANRLIEKKSSADEDEIKKILYKNGYKI